MYKSVKNLFNIIKIKIASYRKFIKKYINYKWLLSNLRIVFEILGYVSCISSITGYIIFAVPHKIPINFYEHVVNFIYIIFIILVIFIVIIIIRVLFYKSEIKLNINDIDLIIKKGNIFSAHNLKIIPFNDQFDYKVDGSRVSPYTLHGKFLSSLPENKSNKFKNDIRHNPHNKNIYKGLGECIDPYPLGTILCYDDFLLLALTHMDSDNTSYIDINEYEPCLRKMWLEINRVYGGCEEINLPIIGGGITRFKNGKLSLTQKLECMICSLQRSSLQYKTKINILIYHSDINQIDLNHIKQRFAK